MSSVQLFAAEPQGPRPLPLPRETGTVYELFDDLPVGVYTALRTFGHDKFLRLEDHFDRLERSIKLLNWDFDLNRPALRLALHNVCTAYPLADARVRVDVLSEPASNLGSDCRSLIALSPWNPVPERFYKDGVKVGFARDLSREEPQVKRANFVLERRRYLERSSDLYEYLLLSSSGHILEGTSSNFFAVRDGVLWTAGTAVLEGIARKIVLELVEQLAIPLCLEPVHENELLLLDETAMSSASRGVIPIVNISGKTVGDGRLGPTTKKLMEAYDALVESELRPALDLPEDDIGAA